MEKPSLLTRDESSAIKGLLMLLIVFGHTGMITTNFATGERTFFWQWLYSFHVYVFLILPFIYDYHRPNGVDTPKISCKIIDFQSVAKDLKHNLIKIGVPYCWFFLFSAIVFIVVGGGALDLKGILYAFVFGNQPLMNQYIGFYFMWFLPAILALMTLKSVWYNSKPFVRWVIVFVSIVLWVLAITKVVSQSTVGMYVPFSISQAFYFILLGLLARWLVEKQFSTQRQVPVVLLLVGACTFLLYLYYRKNWAGLKVNVYTILVLVMPVLMFLLLYSMRDLLSKSKLLKFIGNYSLQIYLVHVYVINALSVLFLHFTKESIGLGVVIYVLTLLISVGLALVMVKVPFVHKILFPK